MEMGGSAQLRLPFLPCTCIDNPCHLQKEQNTTTSCPLFFLVFLYLHPTDPASLSSPFQIAGKEEDPNQRGVAAVGEGIVGLPPVKGDDDSVALPLDLSGRRCCGRKPKEKQPWLRRRS
uniref:Uncharacterized protein n=1 Tax=Populus davidiana TaxID=266767 RepID=A0A6M2E9Q5_9ROSI